jgi:prepilin-type N-terminal cleavage/methylation domain-containing protein
MIKSQLAKARNDESGFTLIELLIVIVVLGVLGGVVVFGVGTFKDDSSLAACNANLKTVSVASDAFIAKNGAPAASVAALVTAKYLKSAPPAGDLITIDAAGEAKSTYPGGLCKLQ